MAGIMRKVDVGRLGPLLDTEIKLVVVDARSAGVKISASSIYKYNYDNVLI